MSSQHLPTDPSRRKTLKALGLASAASVALPLVGGNGRGLAAATTQNAESVRIPVGRPLRVGVLLAGKGGGTNAASRFVDGMRMPMSANTNRVEDGSLELIPEYVGDGVSKAVVTARGLVRRNEADIVVGFLSSRTARWLHSIFADARVPFIEANAGERISDVNGRSPYLFHNSLGLWQAAHAAGDWSADAIGRRCLVITTFATSGFDMEQAFRHGYETRGGTIVATHVIDAPEHGSTPDAAAQAVAESRADLVYMIASGHDAGRIATALNRAGVGGVPVVRAETGSAPSMITRSITVLPWSSSLPSSENRAFIADHHKAHGVGPDAFAVLGHETACWITGAARAAVAGNGDLLQALGALNFVGPRGPVCVDRATHTARAPLYLRELRVDDASSRHEMVAAITEIRAEHPAIAAIPSAHGWLNTFFGA